MLEILAPAASPEAVIAAVESGADSIYIPFGGRGAAFSEDDFVKAVRYCRVRACKVYAELCTLLRDDELTAATSLARSACEAGVAAIVVQDPGFAFVLHRMLPDMALHAGEKLGIHNLAGVEAAAQMGFSRVRLPREMSLPDIALIARHASIEVEVAVQSETCFSHVGACYFAALSEKRSANRGDCPEPCREKYSMGGRMESENPLSLNDVCLIKHLKELTDAGAAAVRIGLSAGKPELTALVTGLYSKCIKEDRLPSPGELEELDYAFSHRKFTDGYFTGERADMFGVYPEPDRDANRVLAEARRAYTGPESRRVPVSFYAVLTKGCALRVAAEDADGNRAAATGPKPAVSKTRGLTGKDIEDALYKTGGTPYSCAGVQVLADEGLELPGDVLAGLRKKLLKTLTEKRAVPPARKISAFPPMPSNKSVSDKPAMIFQVFSAEQLVPEVAELRPDYLYVPLELLMSDFGRLAPFTDAGCTVVAVLPRVITDAETAKVYDLLVRARAIGVGEALVGSLGHVALARKAGMGVRGDYGLNLFNSFAMDVANDAGLLSATASFELRMDQIKGLCKPLDTELIIYGRLPVMLSDQCIIKISAERCACGTPARLSDNKGSVYPVVREFGCRNLVLSGTKLFLADKSEDFSASGLWGLRLCFTTESSRECVEVAKSYMGLSQYRPNGLTRGLYYRGVE